MGSINAEVELPADPQKVWDVFADPGNFEKWLTIHTKWKGEVPRQFSAGSQITEVVTMLGMPNTITWTVDDYEEPKRVRISGTGMAGVKVAIVMSVEPAGDGGSRARLDAEFTGSMIVGALGKAVEKDGQKQLDTSLANFAQLLAG
ncbi:Polyketide cyclase / dehydrase and lipid transport [Amycolatopsis arida]|uniref:Polyketide cyclase / dehydrase and lipid transport n=1 Tax=Amycolatopsis arida TaxID=587909 RepID=A0A1I5SDH8_9PSEU|nr:SRPBCC family protein [Amycolatopsis arida]TDX96512.1 polyketide cyclase/dehydrase/lipid transport protein [Amycolatopsis arida]SFP68752.1 Polyketide cyclase / dehydrase and lipid transport [Amycolatopsis arida]